MSLYHTIYRNKAIIALLALRGLSILSILGLLLGMSVPAPAQAADTILYAAPGGKTTGLCDSWGNACQLSYALTKASAGSEIWAKAGTYLPGSKPDDTFFLKNGVAVYGGFLGVETARDQANWYTHPTILSGDIAGNDLSDLTHMEENNKHVVVAASVDSSAVLSGFFIRSGNAQGTGKAGMGGAVQIIDASPSLENLVLRYNYASHGAGIGCYGNSSPILTDIQYEKNKAHEGGGLSAEAGCILAQTGGVFSANRADTGGAVFGDSATLFVINVSMSGNTATISGGGIANNFGTMLLGNSILWNNHVQQKLDQISNQGGAYLYAFQNIIQGGYSGTNNLDVDPRFAADPTSGADNTWGTADDTPGNLMLRYDSPAIDAGNSTSLTNPGMRDMRNWPRIIDHPRPDTQVGPLVDLGGYEAGIVFARQGAAGRKDGSSWADAFPGLREALAFTHAGDEVWAATGTYQAGTDRTSTFKLKNDVALYGGFAGTEIFRAERNLKSRESVLSGLIANGPDKVYHVVTAANVGPSAILDGFRIQDGNANGAQAPDDRGAGIYLNNASPTLVNLTITQNAAGLGGGIYFTGAQAGDLVNITFSKNQAGAGGGLYLDNANLTMDQIAFQENQATDGGGLYSNKSTYHLTDSVFLLNKAVNGAGTANVGASAPTLVNIYFYGNTANMNGAGMYNLDGASPDLSNAIFAGNSASSAGGVYNKNAAAPTLRNVTLVSNPGGAFYAEINDTNNEPLLVNIIGWDNGAQPIVTLNSLPNIQYSLLEGGCPSQLSASCVNVLSNNPLFFKMPAKGLDNTWGTADDDYGDLRLMPGSKAIDAGTNGGVAAGITTDIAGRPRFIDDLDTEDTGVGPGPIVDMGAYETRFAPSQVEILSANPTPSYAGQAVLVRFQVSGNLGTATGLVEVTDGAAKCSAPANQGQCTLTFSTPGQKSITAHFMGDVIYDSSYSTEFPHHVNQIPTAVTLSLDPPGVTGVGHTVRATFDVSPTIETAYQPGGMVTVSSAGASCTAAVTEGRCDLVFTKPGTYTITAAYKGDTFFEASSSTPVPYEIQGLRATKTTLSVTPETRTVPDDVLHAAFTVTVTDPKGGTASGIVQVMDGDKLLCRVPLNQGRGECDLKLKTTGMHQLVAVYEGADVYGPSTSAPVNHQVGILIFLTQIYR